MMKLDLGSGCPGTYLVHKEATFLPSTNNPWFAIGTKPPGRIL